jgi:hypothetical protein
LHPGAYVVGTGNVGMSRSMVSLGLACGVVGMVGSRHMRTSLLFHYRAALFAMHE